MLLVLSTKGREMRKRCDPRNSSVPPYSALDFTHGSLTYRKGEISSSLVSGSKTVKKLFLFTYLFNY